MDDFDLWAAELGSAAERRAEWGAFWDRSAPAVWFLAIAAVVLYAARTAESTAQKRGGSPSLTLAARHRLAIVAR